MPGIPFISDWILDSFKQMGNNVRNAYKDDIRPVGDAFRGQKNSAPPNKDEKAKPEPKPAKSPAGQGEVKHVKINIDKKGTYDLAVVQHALVKRAEEKNLNEMTYEEGARLFNDRLKAYTKEVLTDANGSRRRQRLQALGLITSALAGSLGGGVIGGILGGKRGLAAGALGGLGVGFLANGFGQLSGFAAEPRTKKEQMDYANSDEGVLEELLVPGVAAYQHGRTDRHVYDALNKEFQKYKVVLKG